MVKDNICMPNGQRVDQITMANNQRIRDDYYLNFKQLDESHHLLTLWNRDEMKDVCVLLTGQMRRFISDLFRYAYRTSNATNLEYIFKCLKE